MHQQNCTLVVSWFGVTSESHCIVNNISLLPTDEVTIWFVPRRATKIKRNHIQFINIYFTFTLQLNNSFESVSLRKGTRHTKRCTYQQFRQTITWTRTHTHMHTHTHTCTHTHTHAQPFYGLFSRITRVSRCQKKSSSQLYGAREDNRGRHTDNPDIRHSVRTNQRPHLHRTPIFMPDSFPATILPIHPGLGQAPNMHACIPSGLDNGHKTCGCVDGRVREGKRPW